MQQPTKHFRTQKRTISGIAALAVASAIGAATVPTAALASPQEVNDVPPPLSAEQMSEHPGATWFAVSNGTVFGSEDEPLIPEPASAPDDGTVTPFLINDPIAWTACFVNHDEDYPLASYTYWGGSDPKIIELQCGYHNTDTSTGHGWHHISAGHESQWRDRIKQLTSGDPTGAGWDDLMSFANDSNISSPLIDIPRGSNNTRCVSAPILMYDLQGDYEYTFNPSVIFSTDTNRVITSIPSSTPSC